MCVCPHFCMNQGIKVRDLKYVWEAICVSTVRMCQWGWSPPVDPTGLHVFRAGTFIHSHSSSTVSKRPNDPVVKNPERKNSSPGMKILFKHVEQVGDRRLHRDGEESSYRLYRGVDLGWVTVDQDTCQINTLFSRNILYKHNHKMKYRPS